MIIKSVFEKESKISTTGDVRQRSEKQWQDNGYGKIKTELNEKKKLQQNWTN